MSQCDVGGEEVNQVLLLREGIANPDLLGMADAAEDYAMDADRPQYARGVRDVLRYILGEAPMTDELRSIIEDEG